MEATGNAALIQLATTSAFTPEQVPLLEKMSNSDDPKVREAVEKILSRLSNAVAEGIETARKTVVPPLEKATGEIANGMIVSFLNAVSDIPGVGFVLSALGLIDTAVKAASSAGQIVEKAQEAAKPVTDAIAEVQETVGKLASEATASAKPPQFVEANPQEPVDPNQPFAIKQTEEEEQQDNAGLGGGGSRKRRRIHKLSRRIERTLRRVQKKYGLKDKGDFLRRTLKR